MTIVHRWLGEPMPRDVARAIERLAEARGVVHVAVMPDVHLAEDVCVGTVVASDGVVYPQAVGGDVGCGMTAIRLGVTRGSLADERTAAEVFAALRARVPAMRQPRPHDVDLGALSSPDLARRVHRDARIEFGTIGRGNHFVEIQADEHDELWLAVHTGSRALGPAIAAHHLALGEAAGKGLVALPVPGSGDDYLRDVEVALGYARASRRAIVDAAAGALQEAIGVDVHGSTLLDVAHNFVRRERHGDREWLVHRKGASSAREGEPGIVPGSMGSRSFHVVGRGNAESLCSSSHGAGRCLSRGDAARRITVRDLERDLRSVFFERALAPRLRGEAPSAYKDIGAVMRAQRDLVAIVRTLRPVLCYKGV
jgi:tRNA-splicing ligase RtcB